MKDTLALLIVLTITVVVIANSKQMNSMTILDIYNEMSDNNNIEIVIDEIGDELITLGITSVDLFETPVVRLKDDSIVIGDTYQNPSTSLYSDLNDWKVTERVWFPIVRLRLSFEEYKVSYYKTPDIVFSSSRGGYIYE